MTSPRADSQELIWSSLAGDLGFSLHDLEAHGT